MSVYARIANAAKYVGISITPGAVKDLFERELLVGYTGPADGVLLLHNTSKLLHMLQYGPVDIDEACKLLYGEDYVGEPTDYVKALFAPSELRPIDTKKMEELL